MIDIIGVTFFEINCCGWWKLLFLEIFFSLPPQFFHLHIITQYYKLLACFLVVTKT